jgi:sugar lactone lactonase YvrE
LWNGNAVIRFDPNTGKIPSKIQVLAPNVSSCVFGGKNLDTIYITTASVDITTEEQVQFPLAGSLFKVVPEVKGVKSVFFGKQ